MTDDNENNMIPRLDEDAAAEMVLVVIPKYARIDTVRGGGADKFARR